MYDTQRLSGLSKITQLMLSSLTSKNVFLVSMIQFQGGVSCPAGLVIRNSSCHLDLPNGTAKDVLHFLLAHLGKFYSQIYNIRLLLNTNSFSFLL